MDKLTSVRIKKHKAKRKADDDDQQDKILSTEIRQHVLLQEKKQKEKQETFLFVFSRKSINDPWQIRDVVLEKNANLKRTEGSSWLSEFSFNMIYR
jgi:hypothetical protein